MKKYKSINMPENCIGIMKFNEDQTNYILNKISEAEKDGRWKTNQDIELNPRDLDSLSYWLAKSKNPIEKPMINSNIEERLELFKKSKFVFTYNDIIIEREITFSAVGDIIATKGLEKSKDKLYEGISDITFNADIIHGNLESTLTKKEIGEVKFTADKTPQINMNIDQYNSIKAHMGRKFDVFTLANNHILDCGEEGITTTTDILDEDGIYYIGVNKTEESSKKPQITEVAGLKIGWVAHTWSVNFKPFPEDKPWIANITKFHQVKDLDITHILDQIKSCREADCDLVFASMHWGLEHEFYPRTEQLIWAQQMADAGVDAIIGHHPHVPQPYEIIYPNNDKTKAVPVIYSLGNITPIVSHAADVLSLVAQFKIVQGKKDGSKITRISNMQITPVAIVQEEETGVLKMEKLKTLLSLEKDDSMEEYINKIAYYADIVVGDEWRK